MPPRSRRPAYAPPPKTLADFDIAPYVRVRMGDDVAACRDELRPVSVPSPLAGEGGEASEAEPDAQRNTRYALPWPPFPDAPPASWRRSLTPRYLTHRVSVECPTSGRSSSLSTGTTPTRLAQDRTQLGVAELVNGAVVVDRVMDRARCSVAIGALPQPEADLRRLHPESN